MPNAVKKVFNSVLPRYKNNTKAPNGQHYGKMFAECTYIIVKSVLPLCKYVKITNIVRKYLIQCCHNKNVVGLPRLRKIVFRMYIIVNLVLPSCKYIKTTNIVRKYLI